MELDSESNILDSFGFGWANSVAGRTFPPATIRELDFFARGLSFEFQLDRALQFTSEALQKIANQMAELHRVAAAILVNAPSADEIKGLQNDLEKISNQLKRDQRFKAGVAIAGALAGIIDSVRG